MKINIFFQACRSLVVASAGAHQPGCLTALTTISGPLEQSISRLSERCSHAMEDFKSRLGNLMKRVEDVAQQTAVLSQRQEQMDSRAADLERQQSCLSDDFSSRMSDSERQLSQISEDVQNLSSSFERSTSDLERQAESAEQRTQELEQQAVDLEVRTTLLEDQSDANLTEVKQLTEQMKEVELRITEAECGMAKAVAKCDDIQLQSKNAKNQEGSQKEVLSLLNHLEERMQRLESRLQPPKPMRSIST